MKPKDCSNSNPRPTFYCVLYPEMRQIAVECGYALAIHGSMARDMDLIAVVWTEKATHPDVLVDKLLEAIGATMYEQGLPKRNEKPHGRLGYTLNYLGDWYIDLSVIPPKGK